MHDQGIRAPRVAGEWLLPICILLCALLWTTPLFAQDGVNNTPPELKDFRLDPENKPAEPKPAPPEIVGPIDTPEPRPPVAAPPIREAADPPTEAQSPLKKAVEAPKPVVEKEIAPQTSGPTPIIQSETINPEPTVTPTDVTPVPASPEPAVAPNAPSTLFLVPWWEMAAAVLALAVAGLAYLYYRRRLSFAAANREGLAPLPDLGTAPIENVPDPLFAPLPTAHAAALTKPAKPPKPAQRPMLDVSFIPAKATISFSSLTIKGELRITNQSKTPAKSMRLRAAIISASAVQNEIIQAFHHDPQQGTIEDLGPAAAAERVAMQIELTIPLSELQTYPLGDQQLFVPIILANVHYEWLGKAAHDQARITCMVGREANPPQPKMGPFRLDLGPRSFASLGQRPLFA